MLESTITRGCVNKFFSTKIVPFWRQGFRGVVTTGTGTEELNFGSLAVYGLRKVNGLLRGRSQASASLEFRNFRFSILAMSFA